MPSASAHVDFVGSSPAYQEVVAEPVDKIVVAFSGETEETGDGFVVTTPQGVELRPEAELSDDGTRYTMRFDPPLVDGEVSVRWSVLAADWHLIEGMITFTTTAPLPTPTVTPAPTAEAVAEPVAPTVATEVPTTVATAQPTTAPTTEPTAAPTPTPRPVGEALQLEDDRTPENLTIDDRLQEQVFVASSAGIAERLSGFVGRFAALAGALLVVGVTMFGELIVRPMHRNIRLARRDSPMRDHVARLIGGGAALLVVGSLLEALAVTFGPSASEFIGSTFSIAVGARVVAGVLALFARPIAPIASLLALGSFVFDGHTVTKGNRLITAVADVVHVASASAWVGGLACLMVLALRGHPDFVAAAARFSKVAPVALAGVALSGVVLSATVLDALADLWQTTWGRLLIAKVLLVAAAAVAGAVNHFSLVPAAQAGQDTARARLRESLMVEVVLFVVVVGVTAALVAAAA